MEAYRKVADNTVVHAVRLSRENVGELTELTDGTQVEELDPFDTGVKYAGINVPTASGMKRLSEGEYLIIDNDNFIVMRPNQFEASYKKI